MKNHIKIKKLGSETLYYGISNILSRVIHFLIIPLQTRILTGREIGLYTEIYSYIAILNILYSFNTDIAFFKFAKNNKLESNDGNNSIDSSFVNSFFVLLIFSISVTFIILSFSKGIAKIIGHPNQEIYIYYGICIMILDAISVIPFAYLRYKGRVKIFVSIQIFKIIFILCSNLFVLFILNDVIEPSKRVQYILFSNIIGSFLTFIFLIKFTKFYKFGIKLNWVKIKKIFFFSLPLVIISIIGLGNDIFTRVSVKYLSPKNTLIDNEEILGYFSISFKLAIIINLAIQAFRYAAEPFFFKEYKEENYKANFVKIMDLFILFLIFFYFLINVNLDLISRVMLGANFRNCIEIIPFISLGYLFFGVYYNLSSWFKITSKAYFGIILSLTGLLISILFILNLTPVIGYWGNTISFVISNFVMMILCYYLGQRFHPIPYNFLCNIILILITFFIVLFLRYILPPTNIRIYVGLILSFLMAIAFSMYLLFYVTKRLK